MRTHHDAGFWGPQYETYITFNSQELLCEGDEPIRTCAHTFPLEVLWQEDLQEGCGLLGGLVVKMSKLLDESSRWGRLGKMFQGKNQWAHRYKDENVPGMTEMPVCWSWLRLSLDEGPLTKCFMSELWFLLTQAVAMGKVIDIIANIYCIIS